MPKNRYRNNNSGLAETGFPPSKGSKPNKNHIVKALLYSHDTMGLGHLQRNLKIARTLNSVYPDFKIVLLTGSTLTSHYRLPAGIGYLHLPPVYKVGTEEYESFYPGTSFDSILNKRKSIILEAAREFAPHILWVDHAPIGMKGELLPALDWIAEHRPSTVTILGLRDIVDSPENVIPLWEEKGIYDTLRYRYRKILIYGDRKVFDPPEEYNFSPDIREKSSFTGYITHITGSHSLEKEHREPSGRKRIFVTIGGGEWAGDTVIGNLLAALKKYKNEFPFDVTVVAGPFFPEELWRIYSDMAKEIPAQLLKFIPDIRPYILSSELTISTAGYNTVTDIMSFGKRALFIPRIKFRNEQLLRARKFSQLGIADMLHPDDVTPDLLFQRISDMMTRHDKPVEVARQKGSLNLNGAKYISEYIKDLAPAAKP